jgi:hypothetical protein
VSYFPDGSIYEKAQWSISELIESSPEFLSNNIYLDSKKRKTNIDTPIGALDFIWTGSHLFGALTILRDGVVVNSGLYLPGNDRKEENELLLYFLDQWRSFDAVKELCGNNTPFIEVESIEKRPLACTMNWATIPKELYNQISYYDLYVGANYFQKVLTK